MPKPVHLYHLFSSFDLGGREARACVLLNRLGPGYRHTVTATNGCFGAAERIAPDVNCVLLPPPEGKGSLFYALSLAKVIRHIQPDVLLTYNWGAFDGVLAATIGSLCPVVHTEDGFNPDEMQKLKARRIWSRRLLLNRVSAVVVPSLTLRQVALKTYRLRSDIVRWIPNGIDLSRFNTEQRLLWRCDWKIGLGDFVIGYVGRLAPEKNLEALLRAVAACRFPNVRLVLAGDGPCRSALTALAAELGLAERTTFTGFLPDPSDCYGAFDLFAMSSITEQMPMALLEAMATGLPVICTEVGDSAEMLGNPGFPCTVPAGDPVAYARALEMLYRDADSRAQMGAANRRRCADGYSVEGMIASYRSIYHLAAGPRAAAAS
jgi:glycosyltransferase involved in cell wall biosynthesis